MSHRPGALDRVAKHQHEVRDPVHVFIHYDSDERKVLNSRPLQRLRYIHQLALTYLVYPGATHRRFEHSLGVMDLAGRVFDVVTCPDNVTDEIRKSLPEITKQNELQYWKRVLRMAALCHDVGHLPFSHAAERELLPTGWDHERLTRAIIYSEEMEDIWRKLTPPLRSHDIVKLALGPDKAKDLYPSVWETILSEIIVGDAFGVDRIDYLLRDSHHTGVAYGKFDHHRLIETLRILPSSDTGAPALGVEEGGLQSAEALLWARYLMYAQVYLHPVRRIYDIHLRDFLKAWLPGGKFSTKTEAHLQMTDNEVTSALLSASRRKSKAGHDSACRIVRRDHYRKLYERNPLDVQKNPEAANAIFSAAEKEFGSKNLRFDKYPAKGGGHDFPVLMGDRRIVASGAASVVLLKFLPIATEFVFIIPEKREKAIVWLEANRKSIIELRKGENG
jgi:HD superfamily phosphohydrolase